MAAVVDAFWRAVAYCLHPRIVALSLLPLVAMVAVAMALGYFFWDAAVNGVFVWLESTKLFVTVSDWLTGQGLRNLRMAIGPLIVVFAITPLLVLVVLLVVALLMMPAIVRLVAQRRFPQLDRKHGGSFAQGVAWSLGSTLLAVVALIVSVPLWLIPPLIFILPPLIWGWLTYRVMTFDALADHASAQERREIVRTHRVPLICIGIATGYLGAAPSVIWASGLVFAALFPILIPVAIWIYTLVFAFASLWFAHYTLAALEQLRSTRTRVAVALPDEPPTHS